MSDEMVKRSVNVGFSGGEKKRNEVLQMAMLKAAARHPRRNGFRSRHRRAETRRRRRQRPARARPQLPGHHPLSAPARPHRARPRARAGGGPHRQIRRPGTRARARSAGLRRDREGSLMALARNNADRAVAGERVCRSLCEGAHEPSGPGMAANRCAPKRSRASCATAFRIGASKLGNTPTFATSSSPGLELAQRKRRWIAHRSSTA